MMLQDTRRLSATIATAALLFATLALGDNSASIEVIRVRQQGLKAMGASLKTVRDQVRLPAPDMTAIKEAGDTIRNTSEKLAAWFPVGSGPESGAKTKARAEIWSDATSFEQKRADLVAAAAVFSKVTASADKDAIRAAIAPLNRTCKGCHDKFYEE